MSNCLRSLSRAASLPEADGESLPDKFAPADFFVCGAQNGIDFPAGRGIRVRGPETGFESIMTLPIPWLESKCVLQALPSARYAKLGPAIFNSPRNSELARPTRPLSMDIPTLRPMIAPEPERRSARAEWSARP